MIQILAMRGEEREDATWEVRGPVRFLGKEGPFELSYTEMHVVSAVKDRKEGSMEESEFTLRNRSTGYLGKPVIR